MKKLLIAIIAFQFFVPTPLFAQSVEEIVWITEEYPPFNYHGKDKLPKGLSVEILQAIWKKMGVKNTIKDIQFFPWARAYNMVQTQKRVCLFSMSITNTRKTLFQFVGPFKGSNIGIIAKKANELRIYSISDLKKLKIGVVRKDIGEKLLLDTGRRLMLHQVVYGEQLIRMLAKDRLDAIAFGDIPVVWNMKKYGIDPMQYEMVYVLKEGISGFAFHKEVDPKTIKQIQKAFDELSKEGAIVSIRNRYLR